MNQLIINWIKLVTPMVRRERATKAVKRRAETMVETLLSSGEEATICCVFSTAASEIEEWSVVAAEILKSRGLFCKILEQVWMEVEGRERRVGEFGKGRFSWGLECGILRRRERDMVVAAAAIRKLWGEDKRKRRKDWIFFYFFRLDLMVVMMMILHYYWCLRFLIRVMHVFRVHKS